MIKNSEVSLSRVNLKPLLNGSEKNVKLVESIVVEIVSYLGKVVLALKDISFNLRKGDISKSSQLFSEVIEGIDWVAQLVSILKDRYGNDFSNLKCNNIDSVELENELLNILTELVPVHIRKDWNLMADIVEHELYRNLCSWSTLLPQIVELEHNL